MRTEKSKPKSRPPRTSSTISQQILYNMAVFSAMALLWVAPLFGQMEFRGPVASLFTDERLYKVGDVITVVVNESMQGTNNARFRSQRGTDVSSEFGVGPGKVFGLFNPFSGAISSSNDFDSRVQNNKITSFITQISARVVRSDELGNLFLEGSKVIDMPDEKLLVAMTGIARSRDISGQNTIQSSQIADLHITMKGKGEAEEARRPTIFNRIFGWFF
ncbi:MAG TPA: flagellar basal body L-ring protein FlgH [archaeon]|nr:flagellar basal body L-ring protein FlgH [archaeon]